MGRTRNHKTRARKNKSYKKSHCTANRARDIDQIQDDLKKEEKLGKKMEFDADDDLPGLGQFYCTPCARHFIDNQALEEHMSSKVHKRRLKDVAQEQYTQGEAEAAAGKTVEILPSVNALRMASSTMV